MTDKELNFVDEQLRSSSKSELLRNALKIYYKHESGKLYTNVLEEIKKMDFQSVEDIKEIEDDIDFQKKISEKINNNFIGEKE